MAAVPGTNVIAAVVPFDSADIYSTHYAFYGRGGHRTVLDLTERNNITEDRREEGMTVYVKATQTTYILKPGAPLTGPTSNTDWNTFGAGSVLTSARDTFNPILGQTVFILANTPNSTVDLEVEYNGNDIYETTDWTLVGNTLTLNPDYALTVVPGDILVVDYKY